MIQAGADVNHIDSNGQNPIFYPAAKGYLEMCKLLVNRNANYQLVDKNKETPIHYARKNKSRNVIEYFSSLKIQKIKHKEKEK